MQKMYVPQALSEEWCGFEENAWTDDGQPPQHIFMDIRKQRVPVTQDTLDSLEHMISMMEEDDYFNDFKYLHAQQQAKKLRSKMKDALKREIKCH